MCQGNHFLWHQISLDLQTTWGCYYAYAVSIYNPKCGTCSVFDSHSMDVTGNPTPEGAAVLLTFDSIEDLSQYLLRLYPNILFN